MTWGDVLSGVLGGLLGAVAGAVAIVAGLALVAVRLKRKGSRAE